MRFAAPRRRLELQAQEPRTQTTATAFDLLNPYVSLSLDLNELNSSTDPDGQSFTEQGTLFRHTGWCAQYPHEIGLYEASGSLSAMP
jgi:hypothetical protein